MITTIFASTLSGNFFANTSPLHRENNNMSTQFSQFPEGFDIWHSPNHWANWETSIRYLNNVIIPYVKKIRDEKEVPSDYPALALFDVF